MLLSLISKGLATQYSSRLWQMEDGLPDTIVQAITQTRDGYLWVGTREGLARFDGVSFLPFDFPGETAHPSVACLYESHDGDLWIGTEKTGLFCLHNGKLSRYAKTDQFNGERITTIQEAKDDTLWIGTSHGLVQLKDGEVQFNRKINLNVWSMCLDHQGALWVAEVGIKTLTGEKVRNYTSSNAIPKSIRMAYCDQDGILWFGQADGLIRIKNGVAAHFDKGEGLSARIDAILKDRKGNVWIGTYGGLSRFVDGKFINENGNRLGPYRVFAIFEDREGNIWIGSEGGLARLTEQYFDTYSRQNGLTLDRTISVCESSDKGMWIGTWGGGLNYLKDGKVTAYTKTNGLASDFVYGLEESRDGSLWIGLDYDFGLDRLRDGQFTHFGPKDGLEGAPVTAIHEDKLGNLWVGTRGGLYRRTGEKFVRQEGAPQQEINALCDCPQAGIWIGTESGLIHRSADGRIIPLSAKENAFKDIVFSLYDDAENTLWVGTEGNGLKRFKNGQFTSYTTKEGLNSDIIYAILEDEHSNLWLSTGEGIAEVGKEDLEAFAAGKLSLITPVKYGKADGIANSSQFLDAVQPAAAKSADGRLWFRTIQGVVTVDPKTIIPNQIPPPVLIEKVIADKKEVAPRPETLNESADRQRQPSPIFNIPAGRGELEIHYAALSFRDPQGNRYKYKLEGWDADWVEADNKRIAYYNNVRPGNYQFRVLAANNDGVWNTTGASIALNLEPHFWQTWPFLGLSGLAAAAAVASAARYITRQKMRRQLVQLEQQHALERERSRIARDIHDDLGARVTHITLLSELAEHENWEDIQANTRKIGAACREMAQSLDEIVWAVNPAHDTLEGLVEYFSQSADEFLEQTNIRLRLNMPREIPPCVISTEVRYQMFLSFREALNNAVKHAAATEIQIDLTVIDGQLQITISDNGKGFTIDSHSQTGNGLKNMRHRLTAIGGQFAVSSQPGRGSTVTMVMALHSPQMCG
jgi:ligand-binding sensor domain-containing protein/signal transduction histidine kinase